MSARFYFDYVDPISYLVEGEVQAAEAHLGLSVERLPLELTPPSQGMLDPDGPAWTARLEEAHSLAGELGRSFRIPAVIPWTHKAHELVMLARSSERQVEMHRRLFTAVFQDGQDIGRIDVLVALAQSLGFDLRETRAALDVDLHTEALEAIRRETAAAGIQRIPTVTRGGERLEGFHNRHALSTFLHATDN
jgi:predicted DsbA family dithiol-disulfide isomerase